ncbi:MAG: hypothetical protein WA821_18540 [Anaerolineales bacterium]
MSNRLYNALANLKTTTSVALARTYEKARSFHPDFHQIIRSKARIGLVALILFGAILFTQVAHPVLPGSLSAFAQGRIGAPTLTLGDFSIHPISAVITDKGPVCLVLLGVEMVKRAFGVSDGEIFLMGSRRTYAAATILPVGQDTGFGQHKVRALAFHPTELCKQGEVRIEDLALLVIHPAGIGIVSFSAPIAAVKVNK